jgi:hypothetical protein
MRITSGGNFGFNTTTPNAISGYTRYTFNTESTQTNGTIIDLNVSGTRKGTFYATPNEVYIGSDASIPAIFLIGGSERMRITSGGYLKASNDGTYNNVAGTYYEMKQTNTSQNILILTNTSADPYGIDISYTGASPNSNSNNFLYCPDSTTLRAAIRSNGGLANYSANNVNLSDERTKKDIIPLESYWDKFKAIEIVKFKYKDQTHDDFNIGVIAQQVEEIAPEFVDVDGFGETPEDGIPYKTIYTSDLHHTTIKVLQEAMTKIETLQAEFDEYKTTHP